MKVKIKMNKLFKNIITYVFILSTITQPFALICMQNDSSYEEEPIDQPFTGYGSTGTSLEIVVDNPENNKIIKRVRSGIYNFIYSLNSNQNLEERHLINELNNLAQKIMGNNYRNQADIKNLLVEVSDFIEGQDIELINNKSLKSLQSLNTLAKACNPNNCDTVIAMLKDLIKYAGKVYNVFSKQLDKISYIDKEEIRNYKNNIVKDIKLYLNFLSYLHDHTKKESENCRHQEGILERRTGITPAIALICIYPFLYGILINLVSLGKLEGLNTIGLDCIAIGFVTTTLLFVGLVYYYRKKAPYISEYYVHRKNNLSYISIALNNGIQEISRILSKLEAVKI